MPAVQSSFFINALPKLLHRFDLVFIVHADRPNDFSAEHPQIVHVRPNRLSLQSVTYQVHHKWPHCVEHALPIRNILLDALPSLRPLGEVWTDIFRRLHSARGKQLVG